MNGTADERVMMNYYSRTIEPVLSAIADEMTRKFLTKTAITQHQKILFIRDPFKLVPVSNVADIADKFTRNEILSPNEIRAIIGRKPVSDDRANELRNRNLNASDEQIQNPVVADNNDDTPFNESGDSERYSEKQPIQQSNSPPDTGKRVADMTLSDIAQM